MRFFGSGESSSAPPKPDLDNDPVTLGHHIITIARKHVATVLLVEPEMPESVSARKLVLERARDNVITAYGGIEGLALFSRFPNVDVVFLHSELNDYECAWRRQADPRSERHRSDYRLVT